MYLDNTSNRHNGWDYEAFCKLYNSKVNPSNLARAFKVDRSTMLHWIEVHKEELKSKNNL